MDRAVRVELLERAAICVCGCVVMAKAELVPANTAIKRAGFKAIMVMSRYQPIEENDSIRNVVSGGSSSSDLSVEANRLTAIEGNTSEVLKARIVD